MTADQPLVWIIDDDDAVRHSLQRLFESEGMCSAAFSSAEDFLESFDPSRPGCVLLDIRMPGIGGIELHRRLAELPCPVQVILLTGHGNVPLAAEAMKRGAVDFLEKPCRNEVLLTCVEEAMRRDRRTREVTRRRSECARRIESLSNREREVLEGLVIGDTVEQIAARLAISPKTVYMHRSHMMQKLGSESLADIVRLKLTHDGAIEATATVA